MAKQPMRILVAIFLIKLTDCQESLSDQDFFRLQHYSINNGRSENIMQRDSQPLSAANVQYYSADNNNGDFTRSDRGRLKKVYHIKNPFQNQSEDDDTSQESRTLVDSTIAENNQYSAMQYSLPPEEFLQKIRNENQYFQQPQLSTQVSALTYTVTPQPQYQYSTQPAFNYDQQSNQMSTTEPKAYTPNYQSNLNSYQYNPYLYSIAASHSTPVPPYVTTPAPSSNYIGTPSNTYVSSSSPMYLSSPQNLQQFVSSPFSNIQPGSIEHNNRVTTVGNSYDRSNEMNRAIQIDHYDNSVNGIRYPMSQFPYQSDFLSSTISPNTSIYSDHLQSNWQNSLSTDLPKSETYAQKQNIIYNYNNNYDDNRQDVSDLSSSDGHKVSNIPAANNLYLNYAQPDYQLNNNLKNKARDTDRDITQSDVYSNGDYGWRMSEKKSSFEPEISSKNNYFKYQIYSAQPETGAVSQTNFQMDSGKPYIYEQNAITKAQKLDAEEFARAAAKAHENYKQQLEVNKYLSSLNYNNNLQSSYGSVHNSYNSDYDKQRNKQYSDSNEIVTSTSSLYNQREDSDNKQKLPFDHEKALKTIVPIDVSNVVQHSETSGKLSQNSESSNKHNNFAYYKELAEQAEAQKHFLRHAVDPYYNDRNIFYSTKLKPEDFLDKVKPFEQNYGKYQIPASEIGNKRYVSDSTQSINLANQLEHKYYGNTQPQVNSHKQDLQRPQISSDVISLLKFNDIPYRLMPSYNSELQRNRNSNSLLEHNNIPAPLPSRVSQNVENHHIDVAAEILNKLMTQKPSNPNVNRLESDPRFSNLMSTISGAKIANPFNVDLRFVADMLKGKQTVDASQISSLGSEFHKPLPIKFDVSQLQQLFEANNDNSGKVFNAGFSSPINSLYDIYNSGNFPHQAVKYSRSEEEPENIPIADSSNNHPIGAVIEEDEANTDVSDISELAEDSTLDEDRYKNTYNSSHRSSGEKHKHSSATYVNRHSYKRKYPKSDVEEPYLLLKPPPPHHPHHRTNYRDKIRRRRVSKPKTLRVFKTEPLFEANASLSNELGPIKRSLSVMEEKMDKDNEKSI